MDKTSKEGVKDLVKCAICREEGAKKWVNPCNSESYDFYCKKHSPAKAFQNFQELFLMQKTGILAQIKEA